MSRDREMRIRGKRMMRYPGTVAKLIIIVLLLSYAALASAQDYRFEVPRVDFNVFVQPDGSVRLVYDMDFKNTPGAHAIDIVDVGLPVEKYDIGNMKAWAGGVPLRVIRPSQYVQGVEVHLEGQTIPPGGSGNFQFEATFPDLIFQDTTRKDLASFQITPMWFGDQYVVGTTTLQIRIHLPRGLEPDEVLYQDVPFTGKEVEDGQVVVAWEEVRRFTGAYRVGVSFPQRVVSRIVKITIWDLLDRWVKQFSPIFWLASVILIVVTYFRFTGGTGGCLIIVVLFGSAFVGAMFSGIPAGSLVFLLFSIGLLVLVETFRRRKRARYLPAMVSVEGGGIKRGLTAPEAAILLESPKEKVLTLILFGLLKKGLVRQVSKKPVGFSVVKPFPGGIVVHPYEKLILEMLQKQQKKSKIEEAQIELIDFTGAIRSMVESLVVKMKGFDLEDTREYYRQIVSRAWHEAKEVGEVEIWQKRMDEKVDWMMLDPDFGPRFRPYQDLYIPRSYRTTGLSIPGVGAGSAGGGGTPAPKFSDIAGSVSGWMENTAGSIVSKLEGGHKGLVDLSALDKAMKSSGSGGRGGGGGGCACACAGCACACACAGGGR